MVSTLKILKTIEQDAPDLPQWLSAEVERMVRERNTTVQAIATAAEISTGYLYRLMKGSQPTVSAEILSRIERVLGVVYKTSEAE